MKFVGLLVVLHLALAPSPAPERPKTLLAVFAHPDDEILVGPLLAAYARQGVKIHLVIVTEGDKGTNAHAGIPAGPELARVRADEARCSARALGLGDPMLLGFKDGELGDRARPPWAPLAQVEGALTKVFQTIRPDVVVTFGPEGGYGHPDHRLVGAVVTQLVQAGVDGAPAALFFAGFPKDRLAKVGPTSIPWSPTDPRFLTVHVPYEAADLNASRTALACHKSQYTPDQVESGMRLIAEVLGGHVHLRPWFGSVSGTDVFTPTR